MAQIQIATALLEAQPDVPERRDVMESKEAKILQAQLDRLNRAVVESSSKATETVARKTMYEPLDAIFTGRGSGG
jgi:hypothetical protein